MAPTKKNDWGSPPKEDHKEI